MKNKLKVFSLLIMLSFLVACISIPVGDNTLEVSLDGIEFVPGDTNDSNDNTEDNELNNEPNNEPNNESNNESNNKADEVSENENNNDEDLEATNNDEENSEDMDTEAGCEEQDHSEITDNIDGKLYIPECAILSKITKKDNGLAATLHIENADWDEISKQYIDFLGDGVIKESKAIDRQKNDIRSTLSNGAKFRVTINQNKEDVGLWFDYKKP